MSPLKRDEGLGWLTPGRSAASGEFDAHAIPVCPPLVGCSGLLGRLLLASNPVAGTTPKIHDSQYADLASGSGIEQPVWKTLA